MLANMVICKYFFLGCAEWTSTMLHSRSHFFKVGDNINKPFSLQVESTCDNSNFNN